MTDIRKEFLDIVADIRTHLEYRRALGLRTVETMHGKPASRLPRHEPAPDAKAPLAAAPAISPQPPAEASAGPQETLEAVRTDIGDCARCKLHKGRTNIVFGEGNPAAVLVFVGEGPGFEEDQQGRPFVGAAGQLLTDIIVKGMKLERESVYICNIVKCRPPGNRNPEPDEVEACIGFVKRQIAAINPRVIVTLGNVPTQNLLMTKQGITKLRGVWQEYQGIPVMPTFHPSYLLRSPGEKKKVWEDIKMVMEKLGMVLPTKESGARSQEPGENR